MLPLILGYLLVGLVVATLSVRFGWWDVEGGDEGVFVLVAWPLFLIATAIVGMYYLAALVISLAARLIS